jgi:hypothetical protein
MDETAMLQRLEQIRALYRQTAERMPRHVRALERFAAKG